MPPSLAPLALALACLASCATQPTAEPSGPSPQAFELVLARAQAGRPLTTGPGDPAVRNGLDLVRPLDEARLAALVARGHSRARVQALFLPQHPGPSGRRELLGWLQQAKLPAGANDDRQALERDLTGELPLTVAEELVLERRGLGLRVTVTQRRLVARSLAAALAAHAQDSDPRTQRLLRDALELSNSTPAW